MTVKTISGITVWKYPFLSLSKNPFHRTVSTIVDIRSEYYYMSSVYGLDTVLREKVCEDWSNSEQ